MAKEVKDIAEIIKKTRILLLDVEGTTTSISFVKDKLFPYAEENVKGYLESQWETDDTKGAVAALRKLALEDQEKSVDGAVVIPGEDASKEDQIAGLVNNVKWQMSSDRKAGALKLLQGLIWKQGYDSGDIKGHVYDDVSAALEQWRSMEGQKVYIYSSGSVQAQKLLFGQSQAGDLLKFIDGHFDTAVGQKQEAASYTAIVDKIGVKPEEILFLTDIVKEAEAARTAGLHVALVSREGNAPLPSEATEAFAVLHSLAQLTVTNKRKNEPQNEQPAKVLKTDTNDDVKSTLESVVSEDKTMEVQEEHQAMEVEEIPVAQKPVNKEEKVGDITDLAEPVDVPMADVKPVKTEDSKETSKTDGVEDSSNPNINDMTKPEGIISKSNDVEDSSNPNINDVAQPEKVISKSNDVEDSSNPNIKDTKPEEVISKSNEAEDSSNPNKNDMTKTEGIIKKSDEVEDSSNSNIKDMTKPEGVISKSNEAEDSSNPNINDMKKPEGVISKSNDVEDSSNLNIYDMTKPVGVISKSNDVEDSSNPNIYDMTKPDEVLAKADEVVAKADKVVAKAGEVIVKADEVVAKADKVVAKADKVVAKADEVVAKADEVVAKVDEVVAKAGEVIGKADEAVVKAGEVIIKADEVVKANQVFKKPDEVEMTPIDVEMKTDEAEMTPDEVEMKSDAIDTMPDDNLKSVDASVSDESADTVVGKTGGAEELKPDIAQVVKGKADDAEESLTTVVTEIEEITADNIGDVAEMMNILEPVVEEPPNEDMEDLQNVGEELEKECDEILSKVQDVTNLDNIPLKPLLNTIAEEAMETEIDAENMDSNDIVDRILDTELELEMKQCVEIDLNTVSEITSDIKHKVEEKNTNNDKEVTTQEIKAPKSNDNKTEDKNQENNKINSTDNLKNDNAEKKNAKINDLGNNIAEKDITEINVEQENKEEKTEGDKMETNVEESHITKGEESIDISAATTDTGTADEAKKDVETDKKTKVNGKAANGDSETVNVNGVARKAEELSSRLSVENGKETVNGSNGDSVSTEKGQGDKMDAETSDLKVKTVATEEIDRTDPIEKPMEA